MRYALTRLALVAATTTFASPTAEPAAADDGSWYPGKYEGGSTGVDDGQWYPGKYEGPGTGFDDGKHHASKRDADGSLTPDTSLSDCHFWSPQWFAYKVCKHQCDDDFDGDKEDECEDECEAIWCGKHASNRNDDGSLTPDDLLSDKCTLDEFLDELKKRVVHECKDICSDCLHRKEEKKCEEDCAARQGRLPDFAKDYPHSKCSSPDYLLKKINHACKDVCDDWDCLDDSDEDTCKDNCMDRDPFTHPTFTNPPKRNDDGL